MTRGGFSRLLGPPVRRPVERKIKGKDFEQVKTFVNIIDGELEQFLKVLIHNKDNNKTKRFS
jgi:hypothetical protein